MSEIVSNILTYFELIATKLLRPKQLQMKVMSGRLRKLCKGREFFKCADLEHQAQDRVERHPP